MKRTKSLPFNENAEKTIIGSIICSKEALFLVLPSLTIFDFYVLKHQIIYNAILHLQEKRLPVDTLTLTEELELMTKLDDVGGVEYLLECADHFISLASLQTYINIVKDNSDLRNFLLTIREIDEQYQKESIESIEEYLKDSQTKIRTCIDSSRTSSFKQLDVYADEAYIKMENQITSGDGYTTGITCGYENINQFTHGFQRGEVTILGARSGVGKTALALNMGLKAAQRSKLPIAIFELEMTGSALAQRMLSMMSGVDGTKIETGHLSQEEKYRIQMARDELKELPIYIDSNSQTTLIDIETKIRQLLEKCPNLGLVIIDHMSIIKTTGGKRNDTRVDEMRKISQGLHIIAKELKIAILALAQLNRDSIKGEVRRPKMSDIKESGAIEQDADVIILLFDALYENNKANLDKKLENVRHIEAIIAKQRNGKTGMANLLFFRQYSRFDMPSKEWDKELTQLSNQYLS